jgi:hypothetical protein
MNATDFGAQIYDHIAPMCKGKNGAFIVEALDYVKVMIRQKSVFMPLHQGIEATDQDTTQKSD